jgi:PPOX class probable F420-dependent enzyme
VTGTATPLGVPETHVDLLSQPLVGVLTTIGADGLPQSTGLWFLLADGELRMSVRTDRQKYRNLLANPKATLFVLDPQNSARTLEIRGEVEIRPDPDKAHAESFGPVYGSAASAWDPEDVSRVVLVLQPRRVVATG